MLHPGSKKQTASAAIIGLMRFIGFKITGISQNGTSPG
jgi:hypothetical protein